jgi:SAM-dependent methyltransferase
MTATRRGPRLLAHLDQPALCELLDRYAHANARPKIGPYKRGRKAELPSGRYSVDGIAIPGAHEPDGNRNAEIVGQHPTSVAIVGGMRQEEVWDVDAAQRYDTPGTGMFAPEVLGPTVDRLASLAGDGPVLEFAIGTGRVAVPLAERGVPVTGIELSPPMIDQLRTKADEATIPVIVGDMATAIAAGKYTLVYLVYNTISNLLTQTGQVACFRNAARHLTPGGRFVIEL